jgi:subtilisin-like proprotein convertase family protein
MIKRLFSLILGFTFGFSPLFLFAQNTSKLWKLTSKADLKNQPTLQRGSLIQQGYYYQLNINELKEQLKNAPLRGTFTGLSSLVIYFPNAYGSFDKYAVMEAPLMHPELSAKYPSIKSYAGQGIDDPTATLRFSVTQFGLHAMVLSGKNPTNYIDPYTADRNYYVVYDKQQVQNVSNFFECNLTEDMKLPSTGNGPSTTMGNINDQKLRTYRLAQSCNAEYGNIFATNPGTEKADIQAQMAITMTRVNGVYERDLAITMTFVPNNDLLIYFGSTSADPWSNEFNTKTAQVIDAAIGVANYDIGHNFNTSGGGSAGCIGCVCTSQSQSGTHKGRGYTGSSNPTGDPFDIDYVAHEMGHQYGGYHVMNTCSRSGSGSTEVEPASGSSIMGYAGICSSNVQSNSHDDFAYVNIRDISDNIQTGASSCGAQTTLTNQPPTASAGFDFVIPKSTAFVLEGSASDPDGTAGLTYNWAQNDPTQSPGSTAPLSTYTVGPIYRALSPSTLPYRYMPNINTILSNSLQNTWEVTPSVARALNFSFIVRDNDVNGGQTASDLMKVTVDGNSGPFVVTSHSTPETINAGTTINVTWNVANTNAGSVNCQNVDILFSVDSGLTYPIVLAASVPNNGSAAVIIPQNAATNKGRLMVRGSGNIFFDINNAYLTVQTAEFFLSSTNSSQSNCPDVDSINYNFNYQTFVGFSDTTYFSLSGLPAGLSATFTPEFALNNNTSVDLVITGIDSSYIGSYNLTVISTSGNIIKNTLLSLNVLNNSLGNVVLNFPLDSALGVANSVTLSWQSTGNGSTYDVEISDDSTFTNLFSSANGLTSNSYTVTGLISSTKYYWRVKASNICSNGIYGQAFSFTTNNCNNVVSTNVPLTISATGTPTINSNLSIPFSGVISDIDVVGIKGTHSYISDLTFSLKSPSNTTLKLIDQICNSENNFDFSLDDAATNNVLPCPPIGGGNYQPEVSLSGFNGQQTNGTWTLSIKDNFSQDGGSLTAWGLKICYQAAPLGLVSKTIWASIQPVLYPNPTRNLTTIGFSLQEKQKVKIQLKDLTGKCIETIVNTTLNEGPHEFIIGNKSILSAGIYIVEIAINDTRVAKKLVVE